jgi:hypothetical protein
LVVPVLLSRLLVDIGAGRGGGHCSGRLRWPRLMP